MIKTNADKRAQMIIYAVVLLFSLVCLYPILMALSISFSDEISVAKHGYSLIPAVFSADAYKFVFKTLGHGIATGYRNTIIVTVLGTLLSITVSAGYGYAASVRSFKYKKLLNLLLYIPMVFSAGLLPWYIICTRYYNLSNTLFALILPQCVNLFNVFLVRNFFSAVPYDLTESAMIDGASQVTIFFRIYVPVARVGLITVALFYALSYWNDFYLSLMFIRKTQLYPLQYYIYNMLSNIEFIKNQANQAAAGSISVPTETVKMAVTCITIGPIALLYPFVQKYFMKGVIVGAVKG